MGTNIYKTWLSRFEADRFTRGECRQFTNVVHGFAYHGKPGGHRTNLTMEEANDLNTRLTLKVFETGRGVGLYPEQIEAGLKYVATYFDTPSPVVDFTYVGPDNYYGNDLSTYRAHMANGEWFDYISWSWVSSADQRSGRKVVDSSPNGRAFVK